MKLFKIIFMASMTALAACGGGKKESDSASSANDSAAKTPAVFSGEAVEGATRKAGFFDIYVDDARGKVLAAFPEPDNDGVALRFIYATGLTAGLGSNPIGLDRGAFDSGVIVAFRRVGDKMIAEQENWRYRASADRDLEKRAVRESFARSFFWAGDILETAEDGSALVDLSSFLTRDHLGVVASIKRHPKGGDFAIAADRSMPDTRAAFAFPDNVELDAFLTLTSAKPGSEVAATAADGRAVTLVQHHSFVRLPEEGFVSRPFDPRTGGIEIAHYDFSAPLDAPIIQRYARRFRLEREDPSAASGPVKEPIVFYVDPGAPDEIRDALIEGASWWAEAFEAAGFEDAYRVELLPDDAHPFDIRYNMIQWTHRQTRGWSYGGGVSDPRTGEMLKANVILGSQRVRQDRMIFEGLAGAEKSGTGADDDPVQIALARIRQLSAHEVGHTLGFAHNFAASSNDRASVMDYPAPYVRPTEEGGLDFSTAYGIGVGAWDRYAAKWLYAQIPEDADEAAELEKIVAEGAAAGLRFVGDREARSVGTGHPYGAVWDNGGDPVATLIETMRVREIALRNFGVRSLREGQPVSDLRKVIVPIYLYHRYQVAAAAKMIGGVEFGYGVKGDGSDVAKPVAPERQRAALQALIATLDPAALDLPEAVLNRLTPELGGFNSLGGGETFDEKAAPLFDTLAAADTAAGATLSALLHPDRVARLVALERRNPSSLGLPEMLDALETKIFAPVSAPRHRAISDIVQVRFVSELIALSMNENASPPARARADAKLTALRSKLRPSLLPRETIGGEHKAWLLSRINAHLNRSAIAREATIEAPQTPPGSPIGDEGVMETCWFCDNPVR